MRPAPRTSDASEPAAGREERGQWLFRAELESPEGRISLRLALRQIEEREYELAAADALGQGVWRLAVRGDDAIWSDLTRGRYCRLDAGETPLLQRVRAPLPAGELSGLLRGTLPEAPPEEDSSLGRRRVELRDEAGRIWAGDRVDGRWASWTLWEGNRPRLWWREEGADSILSGNDPAFQLRWRETARGALPSGAVVDLTSVEGLVEERCTDAQTP